MIEIDLEALHDPLMAVQKLLLRFDNQGLVIGGIAVSLLGSPLKRIELWVREFGEALESPQMWEDLAPLLGSG